MNIGETYTIKLPEQAKDYWFIHCWEEIDGQQTEIIEFVKGVDRQVQTKILTGSKSGSWFRADIDWLIGNTEKHQ